MNSKWAKQYLKIYSDHMQQKYFSLSGKICFFSINFNPASQINLLDIYLPKSAPFSAVYKCLFNICFN